MALDQANSVKLFEIKTFLDALAGGRSRNKGRSFAPHGAMDEISPPLFFVRVSGTLTTPILEDAAMASDNTWPEFASFDAMPDAVIMVDRDGSIVHANEFAEGLFGYEQGTLIGLKIEMLLPERFRKRHPEFVGQFFAEPVARPIGLGRELFAIRRDGQEFSVEVAIGPIRGGDLAVAVVRDITAIVATRNELANTLITVRKLQDRLKNENLYL
jgi:PAS domain S-box-containing protein